MTTSFWSLFADYCADIFRAGLFGGALLFWPGLAIAAVGLFLARRSIRSERGVLLLALAPLLWSMILLAYGAYCESTGRHTRFLARGGIFLFLALEVLLCDYAFARARRCRLAVVGLTVMQASIAFWSGFLAAMAESNDWM